MEHQNLDYLSLIERQLPEREAFISGERSYTYGMLADEAEKLRAASGKKRLRLAGEPADRRRLRLIREQKTVEQLLRFLAFCGTEEVPVIVPWEMKIPGDCPETEIPRQACMAVSTSGTTGAGKLLFRTLESWQDYFPIQNEIFGMGGNSRIFMQGSLAFTGNLNLCIAQLASGGTVIAEEQFDPRLWLREIEDNRVDVIYLIPAKLRARRQVCERAGRRIGGVRTLISGSQSLGGREAREYKTFFPGAELILYYGASELNYITYVRGTEMNEDKTLVGRPFPQVNVRTEGGKIRVTTDYGVIGIGTDSFIGDYGHFDRNGFLYFDGRKDDICNINGRKVSAVRVEQALAGIEGIAGAAVKRAEQNGHDTLAAWIELEPGYRADASELRKQLAERLTGAEIPRQYIFVDHLPVNESGKVLKRALKLHGGEGENDKKI